MFGFVHCWEPIISSLFLKSAMLMNITSSWFQSPFPSRSPSVNSCSDSYGILVKSNQGAAFCANDQGSDSVLPVSIRSSATLTSIADMKVETFSLVTSFLLVILSTSIDVLRTISQDSSSSASNSRVTSPRVLIAQIVCTISASICSISEATLIFSDFRSFRFSSSSLITFTL